MKTKDFSVSQLHEYFREHVRYEMQLLLNARIAISQKMQVPVGLEYMPVESFAIHLRNLITFLYHPTIIEPRPDDVYARDYFENSETWEMIRPKISQILKAAKNRVSVEVGHLTTHRKNGHTKDKEWDVEQLTREIMPIFALFCQSADKVKLSSDIEELIAHYSYAEKLQMK